MKSKIHLWKRDRKGRWLCASRVSIVQMLFESPWLMEHLLPPVVTAALAQGTSSFPADRDPLPPWTSREKGFSKQNDWQSNLIHVYWVLYFYISLFSEFNIPQCRQKGTSTSGFSGGLD